MRVNIKIGRVEICWKLRMSLALRALEIRLTDENTWNEKILIRPWKRDDGNKREHWKWNYRDENNGKQTIEMRLLEIRQQR